LRALVIDDNDQILDVLSFLLESNNIEFKTVNNGKDALDLIFSSDPKDRYDIIFLDLAMPEMSGFQVVDQLYKKNALGDKKVVVITALELSAEDESSLLQKGITTILKKPFLVEDVEKILS
jgi:CheY-like chemotaxis protein